MIRPSTSSGRRSPRPDWRRLRESQRPWLRRVLGHGIILGLMCLVTSLAIGYRVLGPTDRAGADSRGATGAGGSAESGVGGGGEEAGPTGRDGEEGGRYGTGRDAVEFTLEGHRGTTGGKAGGAAGGASGASGPAGKTIRIRFDPTPRLRMFLRQIDELDHEQTVASLNKFIAEFGETLEREGRLVPVLEFVKMIDEGSTLFDAVMNTMRTYGPAGKDTLDVVFDVKRADYEESLNKYLYLKQQGVAKDYKIYRYQQKVWMVDEMRGEFNKSFTFE